MGKRISYVLTATILFCIGSVRPAFAQSGGDILRHMADCEDDYKTADDSSAYLRCMADVQDEIDGLDNSTSYRPSEADRKLLTTQGDFNVCEFRAKTQADKDKCEADYRQQTGSTPDPVDTATAHGKFTACLYLATTTDEVDKCNADFQTATQPKLSPSTTNNDAQSSLLSQVKENAAASTDSPAALAAVASGYPTSPQQTDEPIKGGNASRCLVITSPSGATLFVDGKLAGKTPLAFYLFRHQDTPRTLTLKLAGYNTIEKQETPNGHDIVINLSLVSIK